MPCTDGGPSYSDYDRLHAKIRELTALLCEACAAWGGTMPPLLAMWNEAHQAEDRERIASLKRQREHSIERLRRQRAQIDAELSELDADRLANK